MTRLTSLALPPLVLLLSLAGCDRIFYAGLSQSSTPEQPVFAYGSKENLSGEAWVTRIAVSGRPRADTSGCWQDFWCIEAESGRRYVAVDEVRYGEAPGHFTVVTSPESLPAGYIYSCATGFHGLGNTVYFEITADSSGRKSIRALTEEEFQALNPGSG